MPLDHRSVWPGQAFPLGATWDGRGVNFALFSANAEKVELCLFDNSGRRELARIPLPECTNQVWHGYLPEARPGLLYGYRVYGPYDPRHGHRFNHHKLLIDPYAKELVGVIRWSDANFGYRPGSPRGDLSFDRRDSARCVPKCRVVESAFTWGDDRPLNTSWERSVVYEMHVRGFTMRHPEVARPLRGTFAGLSSPAIVDYLVRLGVTAVELLPVNAIGDERHLITHGLRNYWGYSPMAFLCLEQRYMATGSIAEFKTMVRIFHDAGIEVILDVVYNHTAEGNEAGPTLCFRGIDNATYYRLLPNDPRRYINDTGCGNTLNLSHPRVLQMVMDSLRYFVREMHVDGFRFDLATTLSRESWGFDAGSGFLDAVAQDPVLSRVKLIAEPWDIGPGGYQVGYFPPGWAEWNDKYRDSVRKYWKGDSGVIGEVAHRITGSSDVFETSGRHPWASVNFISAHDGFTLRDLVSYNRKHNFANGEDNRDGTDNNNSWNCGVEGPTADAKVNTLRLRQSRNLLATLILSQGVPMIVAGDEFGRSQRGNNNAYCQDNEISWVAWQGLEREDLELLEFVRGLLRMRRKHPVFRQRHFFRGRHIGNSRVKDITWLAPKGREMKDEDWLLPYARCFGLHLSGYISDGHGQLPERPQDDAFVLLLNAHHEELSFTLPPAEFGQRWDPVIDTARLKTDDLQPHYEAGRPYPLMARSLALLTGAVPFPGGGSAAS